MGNAWKIIPASEIGMRPSTSSYVVDGLDYGLVFDPEYYLITNSDVYAAFGDDWPLYYKHYIQYGYSEGRTGY